MKNKPRVKVMATGRVAVSNGKFFPCIHLEVGTTDIEGVLEEEAFDTHQECQVFLTQQMDILVQSLCEKLGYDIIRFCAAGPPPTTMQ